MRKMKTNYFKENSLNHNRLDKHEPIICNKDFLMIRNANLLYNYGFDEYDVERFINGRLLLKILNEHIEDYLSEYILSDNLFKNIKLSQINKDIDNSSVRCDLINFLKYLHYTKIFYNKKITGKIESREYNFIIRALKDWDIINEKLVQNNAYDSEMQI